MTYKFTKSSEDALKIASEIAVELGHNYLGTEHILYGLAEEQIGVASKVLEDQGVTPEKIMGKIEELVGVNENGTINTTIGFTPRTKRIV